MIFLCFSVSELTAAPANVDAKSSIVENRQNKAVTPNCPRTCPVLTTPEEPVCGSDGLIYANSCEMKKKTCSRNGVANVKVSIVARIGEVRFVGEIILANCAARNITKSLKIHDSVLRNLRLSCRNAFISFELIHSAAIPSNGWTPVFPQQ